VPAGFPKTAEAAKAHASFAGCTEEYAEKIWHLAISRGGRDSKDNPIRNWRSYLKTQWTFAQEEAQKQKNFKHQPQSFGSGSGRFRPKEIEENLQAPIL